MAKKPAAEITTPEAEAEPTPEVVPAPAPAKPAKSEAKPYTWEEGGWRYLTKGQVPENGRITSNPVEVAAAVEGVVKRRPSGQFDEPFRPV